jgi:hypothetical protein
MAIADRVICSLKYTNSFFFLKKNVKVGLVSYRYAVGGTKKVKENKTAPEEVDFGRARPRDGTSLGPN